MNSTNHFNITDSVNDEELKKILQEIISNNHKHHNEDWIYYAKPNEKKGLFILSKVIKHKGQKIFKTQLTKTKEEESDISKLTMDEAYKRYQQKKIVSSYSEFYGGNLDNSYKYNNIMKFKEFENINYVEILKKEFHPYVSSWIKIEKSEQYKEYVLDFMRSFLATVRSNRKFVTLQKEQFCTFKNTDKFTPHAPYLLNRVEKYEERTPTLEEMRARLNLDSYKFEEMKTESNYGENYAKMQEINDRKKQLTQGNKNIMKGIYSGATITNYQETFKGQSGKYPYSFKNDMYSSGIKGISPDPLVMRRINSTVEINDVLKNTVKNIMFNENLNSYSKYR